MQDQKMTKIVVRLFWLFAGIITYTFLGYPLLAGLLARLKRRPVTKAPITPEVTILIPAYNEAGYIAAKIDNCLALEYPADKLRIVVAADGSDDETVVIAARFADVAVYAQPERKGKAAAINRVMPFIKSEIVLFTDANAMLTPGSLRALVANFADPAIGGVAGEKRVASGGEGLYWRYESFLKHNDSQFGSVMGAAGEIFAIRRSAFLPTEEDAIIEDFVLSLRLVAAGWRVIYEPDAVAWETAAPTLSDDWQRRTRIAAGGLQSVSRLPEMMNPRLGWPFWQYLSHRVLRWVVTPFLLPALLLSNLLLVSRPLYRLILVGQLAFYGSGMLGYLLALIGLNGGFLRGIFYFCLANLAALAGIWRYVTGRQPVTWRKIRRS
jgi:biofilm PGA synthesis N-glycosyltransferase PgaC